MKKLYKTTIFIILSLLLLGIYLYVDSNHGSLHNQILSTDILSYEQIEQLSAGKKDAFMQPEITFNDDSIAYDSEQNMLLIPQNLSEDQYDGKLSVSDGKLYFLEDEEGFSNKSESISQNRVFRLFWIRDTQVWIYNVYFTGMPVMCLSTNATIYCEESEKDDDEDIDDILKWEGNVWLSDPYHTSTSFQITDCNWHKRGATTMNYEKAGYKLNLDHKKSFLGMRKDDDWILNALYDDEGLIHNKLSYQVWQEIASSNSVANDEGISMEYVELFVDQEYRGIYGLSERIDKKSASLSSHDILYKYRSQEFASKADFYPCGQEPESPIVTIEYPKDFDDSDWNPMRTWISMFNTEQTPDYEKAKSLLNMENAIDYNLFNQLIYGMDNIMKNVYFKAEYQSNGSYQFIKIPWDLNMTWGNSWVDDYNCGFNRYKEENITSSGGFSEDMLSLYQVTPPEISEQLLTRWQELRQEIITPESIIQMLDQELAYLHGSGAYARNLQKWPPTCDHWQESQLYEYIYGRIAFLDSYYSDLYKSSHNQESGNQY